MSKFKVGDKVRFVKNLGDDLFSPKLGEILEVEQIVTGCYQVIATNGQYFREEELELVEEKTKMDLTKITSSFGLLDAETQKALKEYKGTIEYFDGEDWVDCRSAGIHGKYKTYRVKPPEPLVDMTIPWDAIKEEFQWAAAYEDGTIKVYTEEPKPSMEHGFWFSSHSYGCMCFRIEDKLTGVSRGNKPWDQTLQQRPKKEVK